MEGEWYGISDISEQAAIEIIPRGGNFVEGDENAR
jgi:hypothetical protein